MSSLIRTERLSKQFGRVVALSELSLEVGEGQVVALLGHNGAGKTTTMRLLAGILAPTSGRALIAGLDVATAAPAVRRLVGILTETPGLYARMTARDYIDFFGELYGMPAALRRARSASLFEQFGIAHATNRRLGEYSKGMRQKVALIRAMVHSPRVLFLDEPTSTLDPASAHQVREAIAALRADGQTVLLSTHNLYEAELLADEIAIIRRGRLLAFGRPEELKRRYLGLPLFELDLARPLDQPWPILEGIEPDGLPTDTRLRFRAGTPDKSNPLLLSKLYEMSAEVVSLAPVPQSLEQVYLRMGEDEPEG